MSKDLLNNVGVVKRLLLKIKYEHAVDIQSLLRGQPESYLPILHHAFLNYSKKLASFLVANQYELYSKNDLRFTETVFALLRSLFSYNPKLTVGQFLQTGYVNPKLTMLSDVINLCIAKSHDLNSESPEHKERARARSAKAFARLAYARAAKDLSVTPRGVGGSDRGSRLQQHLQQQQQSEQSGVAGVGNEMTLNSPVLPQRSRSKTRPHSALPVNRSATTVTTQQQQQQPQPQPQQQQRKRVTFVDDAADYVPTPSTSIPMPSSIPSTFPSSSSFSTSASISSSLPSSSLSSLPSSSSSSLPSSSSSSLPSAYSPSPAAWMMGVGASTGAVFTAPPPTHPSVSRPSFPPFMSSSHIPGMPVSSATSFVSSSSSSSSSVGATAGGVGAAGAGAERHNDRLSRRREIQDEALRTPQRFATVVPTAVPADAGMSPPLMRMDRMLDAVEARSSLVVNQIARKRLAFDNNTQAFSYPTAATTATTNAAAYGNNDVYVDNRYAFEDAASQLPEHPEFHPHEDPTVLGVEKPLYQTSNLEALPPHLRAAKVAAGDYSSTLFYRSNYQYQQRHQQQQHQQHQQQHHQHHQQQLYQQEYREPASVPRPRSAVSTMSAASPSPATATAPATAINKRAAPAPASTSGTAARTTTETTSASSSSPPLQPDVLTSVLSSLSQLLSRVDAMSSRFDAVDSRINQIKSLEARVMPHFSTTTPTAPTPSTNTSTYGAGAGTSAASGAGSGVLRPAPAPVLLPMTQRGFPITTAASSSLSSPSSLVSSSTSLPSSHNVSVPVNASISLAAADEAAAAIATTTATGPSLSGNVDYDDTNIIHNHNNNILLVDDDDGVFTSAAAVAVPVVASRAPSVTDATLLRQRHNGGDGSHSVSHSVSHCHDDSDKAVVEDDVDVDDVIGNSFAFNISSGDNDDGNTGNDGAKIANDDADIAVARPMKPAPVFASPALTVTAVPSSSASAPTASTAASAVLSPSLQHQEQQQHQYLHMYGDYGVSHNVSHAGPGAGATYLSSVSDVLAAIEMDQDGVWEMPCNNDVNVTPIHYYHDTTDTAGAGAGTGAGTGTDIDAVETAAAAVHAVPMVWSVGTVTPTVTSSVTPTVTATVTPARAPSSFSSSSTSSSFSTSSSSSSSSLTSTSGPSGPAAGLLAGISARLAATKAYLANQHKDAL